MPFPLGGVQRTVSTKAWDPLENVLRPITATYMRRSLRLQQNNLFPSRIRSSEIKVWDPLENVLIPITASRIWHGLGQTVFTTISVPAITPDNPYSNNVQPRIFRRTFT